MMPHGGATPAEERKGADVILRAGSAQRGWLKINKTNHQESIVTELWVDNEEGTQVQIEGRDQIKNQD